MTRAERLAKLRPLLELSESVLTDRQLASLFGTTVQTIRRDIEYLGNHSDHARADNHLVPKPLASAASIFSEAELEAILVGLSWVAEDEEAPLAEAASEAIRKVEAMLPPHGGDTQSLPSDDAPPPDIIRAAIAGELKLHLDYRDAKGRATARIVWPLELEEYDDTGMIAAWCEHRGDFRNFRLDRIRELHLLERYPVRRKTLLARLQLQQSANDWY